MAQGKQVYHHTFMLCMQETYRTMFIFGLLVGFYVGFFFASLCVASARADRKDNHDF